MINLNKLGQGANWKEKSVHLASIWRQIKALEVPELAMRALATGEKKLKESNLLHHMDYRDYN